MKAAADRFTPARTGRPSRAFFSRAADLAGARARAFLRRVALAIVVAGVAGCNSLPRGDSPFELLYHEVPVPRQYRGGDPWPGDSGDLKRFTNAYEAAWWRCVADFARDMDHRPTTLDRATNGWPPAVDGGWAGYTDAEARVARIARRFGRERARDILRAALNPST